MDITIIFPFIIGVAALYLWMRQQLSNYGRNYPLMNSSFKIYVDFQEIASSNPRLRYNYRVFIICICIVQLGIILIVGVG